MTGESRRSGAIRLSRRALLTSALLSPVAWGLGRKPYEGVLRLSLPFDIGALDPHSDADVGSAVFSAAIADPLFAWDASGSPYPALADGMPQAVGGGARVTLRRGLTTASGRELDARDVLASLERSRRGAGRPLLGPFAPPKKDGKDPLSVVFPDGSPERIADALSSPVTAIVSRASLAGPLDGTGAFRERTAPTGRLVLERNERAARGASFLDRIEIERAADLAGPLRAFESGDADVGFLGAGLHRRRPGAVDLRTAPAGFAILRSGPEAGSWGAPGIAATLVRAMDPGMLSHLGLAASHVAGDAAWGGPPGDILVAERAPYFVEVARIVAAVLSRPGHELRPLPLPAAEFRARKNAGRYALAVDFVRRIGPTPRHAFLSLLAAADPRLADKPPRSSDPDPVTITRTLPLAVLGELSISGARIPELHGLEAWDLGSVYRQAP